MTAPLSAASPSARERLLAALVQLERRARACPDALTLGLLMVNDTQVLAPYRQAALWLGGQGRDGRLLALSGVAMPDADAPFNLWLSKLLARRAEQADASTAGALPVPEADEDRAAWMEYLPAHAWWQPLDLGVPGGTAPPPAALVFWRETPWRPAETHALGLAADAYAHAWRALRQPAAKGPGAWFAGRAGTRKTRRTGLLALLLAGLLLLPVRQSVLAPAEVVARTPAMVRAPVQGVVDRILVQPNQAVRAGDLLATLDARELESRLEAARQALAVAQAELRQGQQQALLDERSKAGVALLQGKQAQAANDVAYLVQSLARTQLHAERDGIALFDDPSDWIGKPVALGERIMMIADPHDAELEVELPIADAIALAPGAPVRLFLNAQPDAPVEAALRRVGYRATPTADGTLAYRVRAAIDPEESPASLRVGLKGTAKLYGDRTVLALYVLRRPLAALRTWMGF